MFCVLSYRIASMAFKEHFHILITYHYILYIIFYFLILFTWYSSCCSTNFLLHEHKIPSFFKVLYWSHLEARVSLIFLRLGQSFLDLYFRSFSKKVIWLYDFYVSDYGLDDSNLKTSHGQNLICCPKERIIVQVRLAQAWKILVELLTPHVEINASST